MIGLDIHYNGTKWWYRFDQRHRSNGPAVITSAGDYHWFYNGIRHRTDGPAVILTNGFREYWFNDKHVTEFEHMFLTGNDNG